MNKKAIILFSGGLDSTTCLALAKSQGYTCYTLTFHYGQKHHAEVEKARRNAHKFGVIEHKLMEIPVIGGSALTEEGSKVADFANSDLIPSTYVPARNTIFLAFALSWGELLEAYDIFIGVNAVDYSNYPDCRPAYLEAFSTLASLATRAGVEGNKRFQIHAPLLRLTKAEIIREGIRLGVDYSETVSCYRADSDGRACGTCDSCAFRKKGFVEAGERDPTRYY